VSRTTLASIRIESASGSGSFASTRKGKRMSEEIKQVYEKYKHLDELVSDFEWLPQGILRQFYYDLWQAIKKEATKEEKENGN
jgi:hypothetical protein